MADRRKYITGLECFRTLVCLWSLELFLSNAQQLNHTNFNSPLPLTTLAAATMLPAWA